jgi:arylsulfatase A-like enzyme
MPTAERLAAQGLKYTRFHTTALCSPTRAALLSGRNHHAVGMGSITETATSAPGYSGVRPNTMAPLAETRRLNGYATAQFGKCHEVPVWETSPAGPFDRWPTGNGFEYFYGFIGGETNQWYPDVVEGTAPVEPWGTPEQGYHLMPDLTDRAIKWVRQQKALTSDRPFFCYFAPGATHAPHHVPKDWADRYKGRFDQGWDRLRRRRSPARSSSASSPRTPSSPGGMRRSRPGRTWTSSSSRCWPARWRSTPGSWSTPTTTSAASSTPSRRSGCWTTPWSTPSSATTAPPPRARRRAP